MSVTCRTHGCGEHRPADQERPGPRAGGSQTQACESAADVSPSLTAVEEWTMRRLEPPLSEALAGARCPERWDEAPSHTADGDLNHTASGRRACRLFFTSSRAFGPASLSWGSTSVPAVGPRACGSGCTSGWSRDEPRVCGSWRSCWGAVQRTAVPRSRLLVPPAPSRLARPPLPPAHPSSAGGRQPRCARLPSLGL